jgi:hypothetical protein
MPINKRLRKRVEDAARLFEGFSGEGAEVVGSIDIPSDDTLMVVGVCEAIAYNATRDGETHSYQHEFAPSARPVLAVSSDGKRLYLLAGAYEFTHHGIEDR